MAKSRFFTEKEVKDFRRLSKVYNYKSITTESDLFIDENTSCVSSPKTNVVKLTISFRQITGTDERNLGNIAKLTKSSRITLPSKNKMIVEFKKRV